MTTQPPDPADEQPQPGDIPPSGAGDTAPAPMPPPAGYPPQGGYEPMAPAPAAEYGGAQAAYGAVPAGMYYDAASGLLLPQGTQLASVGRRIGAYFLSIGLWIITLGIGYIVWGLIVWANGQTPALQVLGMRCWRPETRQVAGWWWMALREIIGRFAEGVLGPITAIASFVLMVAGKERKALHDWVAGTVVLYDPDKTLSSGPPAQ